MSETPKLSASYRCDACGDKDTHQRPATPDELRAAVLPLIDYEAAAKAIIGLAKSGDLYPTHSDRWAERARSIVDAALGLKEKE